MVLVRTQLTHTHTGATHGRYANTKWAPFQFEYHFFVLWYYCVSSNDVSIGNGRLTDCVDGQLLAIIRMTDSNGTSCRIINEPWELVAPICRLTIVTFCPQSKPVWHCKRLSFSLSPSRIHQWLWEAIFSPKSLTMIDTKGTMNIDCRKTIDIQMAMLADKLQFHSMTIYSPFQWENVDRTNANSYNDIKRET